MSNDPHEPNVAHGADTLVGVLREAAVEGYAAHVTPREGGTVSCGACDAVVDPGDLEVTRVRRLEGVSDPADLSLVAFVRCPSCDTDGVLVLGYGPNASAADTEVLARLDLSHAETDAPGSPTGAPTGPPQARRVGPSGEGAGDDPAGAVPDPVVPPPAPPTGDTGPSPGGTPEIADARRGRSDIDDPAELVRIGTMLARLSAELQELDLDAPTVDRLRELHGQVVTALGENLDESLVEELCRFVPTLGDDGSSESETRVAHVQLVGWLEGLFQGIQMSAMTQQLRRQLEERRSVPSASQPESFTGTYL